MQRLEECMETGNLRPPCPCYIFQYFYQESKLYLYPTRISANSLDHWGTLYAVPGAWISTMVSVDRRQKLLECQTLRQWDKQGSCWRGLQTVAKLRDSRKNPGIIRVIWRGFHFLSSLSKPLVGNISSKNERKRKLIAQTSLNWQSKRCDCKAQFFLLSL